MASSTIIYLLACVLSIQCMLVERSTRVNSQQLLKSPRFASSRVSFPVSEGMGKAGRQKRQVNTCGLTDADILNMEPVSR